MKKTIVFDLDGTLIHSLPEITKYLNVALEHYGYPLIDDNRTREIIGCGARMLVKGAINEPIPEQKLDEILDYYNYHYTKSDSSLTTNLDGVEELLYASCTRYHDWCAHHFDWCISSNAGSECASVQRRCRAGSGILRAGCRCDSRIRGCSALLQFLPVQIRQ